MKHSIRAHTLFLFLALLLVPQLLHSQDPVEKRQAFLDLQSDEVLMNVAAHPDDEDGATLAYYRMKFGVKTYSVIFTRGEGGQNEKGPELYEELGVIRTAETEAAARILGSQVYFLNLMDFGFSKNATEAFQKWGSSREVLRRLVFMIRKLKPDVVFTNHNTIDGHGHHQAVAITAIAAFDAAADSTFFPEQLREPGSSLWQPKKLFFRNFSRVDPTADAVNTIQDMDNIRNMSYLDIAVQALQMHKTQGMERANLRSFTRGVSIYKLMRSSSLYERDTTSFFAGINFWRDEEMDELQPLYKQISGIRADRPRDSILSIVSSALPSIRGMENSPHRSALADRILQQWREKLERLAVMLCGVQLRLGLQDSLVVAKQKVAGTLGLSTDNCDLSNVKYRFDLPDGWAMNEAVGSAPALERQSYVRDFELIVGDNPILTVPAAVALYRPLESRQRVVARIEYSLDGHAITASVPARFEVAPRLMLSVQPKIARISPTHLHEGKRFEYTVRNYLPHKIAGTVRMVGPAGWRAEASSFAIGNEDGVDSGRIFLRPPDDTKAGEYTLTFKTDYASDSVTVKVFDVAVAPDLLIGVIRSYDDVIESALAELGVRYKLLEKDDLQGGNLSKYTTIVVDIRAYLVRDDLKNNNARLLDYVKGGGNLLVMYQRDQEWKPEYAPFPFQISRKRVCVEEAPVTVLQPQHPLFNSPNAITEQAWLGWKQERAVYFPTDVAKEYTQLLVSHDPDEAPLTTGCLVADVGSGSYIYTSFVWYRQMKELHSGALACFANMISYPKYRRPTR